MLKVLSYNPSSSSFYFGLHTRSVHLFPICLLVYYPFIENPSIPSSFRQTRGMGLTLHSVSFLFFFALSPQTFEKHLYTVPLYRTSISYFSLGCSSSFTFFAPFYCAKTLYSVPLLYPHPSAVLPLQRRETANRLQRGWKGSIRHPIDLLFRVEKYSVAVLGPTPLISLHSAPLQCGGLLMNFASADRKRRYSVELRGSRDRSLSPRVQTPSSRCSSARGSTPRLDDTPRPFSSSRRDSVEPSLRRPSPAVLELLPAVQDTSIRATSSNPKVRDWTPSVRAARESRSPAIDFTTEEATEALAALAKAFGPIVLRQALRRRRLRAWPGSYPPRHYETESVVTAITTSTSIFSRWPLDVLYAAASEAVFEFRMASEPLVYYQESYISSGIVVLLYGEVQEQRRPNPRVIPASERPVHANRVRTHRAPATLCDVAVLSEDCCMTSFIAAETVDVAIIPSRWFWEVVYRFVAVSPGGCDAIFECFQQIVLPYRTDMLLTTYYPTSVVLQRSWMWPYLSVSDRVKLARTMEVKTLTVGETLCEEGTYSPYLYVLRRGALSVLVKGVLLGTVEPGAAFGEVSVVMGDPRNCTIVANTIAELYCLHAEELLHRFYKYPEVAETIVTKAVERRQRWMELGKRREIFGLAVLLQGVPCLSHTTESTRLLLAEQAAIVSLPAGAVVAQQGSHCDALFVIGRGTVRLTAVAERRSTSTSMGSKKLDRPPSVPQPAPADAEETRSCGDFFGEHCLSPHNWWVRVSAEATVDLWRMDQAALRQVLAAQSSLSQAQEVCRQGIVLYQARHGAPAASLEEVSRPLAAVRGKGSRPPSGGRTSGGRLTSTPPDRDVAVNWVRYAVENSATALEKLENEENEESLLRQHENTRRHVAPRHMREMQPADKANEQAMKAKVKELISNTSKDPNAADCDLPAEMKELEAVIVEQLFLTPTEDQARFLQQVNDSNVKLVADEEPAVTTTAADDLISCSAAEHQLLNETVNGLVEVNRVQSALPLDEVDDAGAEESRVPRLVPEDILSIGSASVFPGVWSQLHTPANFIARPGGHEDTCSTTVRSSFSRSYLQRPLSSMGASNSPRQVPQALADSLLASQVIHRGSRAVSADFGATTASLLQSSGQSGLRKVSVDLSYQNKVKTAESLRSSTLDRFVKVRDEDYLNAVVKVMPVQQEVWEVSEMDMDPDPDPDPDADAGGGASRSESPRNSTTPFASQGKILMLLHVHQCQYLDDASIRQCKAPIVKVAIKNVVRLRTPPMSHRTHPKWTVKESSFITFVSRNEHIDFEVCDAAAEKDRRLYRCSLPVSEFESHNGIGQRTMRLFPMGASKGEKGGKRTPRLTVTMVAILSSQYRSLQHHLGASEPAGAEDIDCLENQPASDADANNVVFQVVGVQELKHRVEAMIVVSLQHDGRVTHVLETPRVLPKTRTPSWPGAVAYATVQSDGFLCFDLFHKDAIISSVKVAVDSLAFAGVGLRRLPMLLMKSRNDIIGQLQLNVLRTSICGDSAEDHCEERVLYLHVERCQLLEGYDTAPDLLVVVKNEKGEIVMTTPLALGTFDASWHKEDASCFIPCPYLAGSSTAYALEVYDSEATAGCRIGGASVRVTREGLGAENRYDVGFNGVRGQGSVRLTAVCLPVLDLPGGRSKSYRHPRPTASRNSVGPQEDLLLLVHLAGCRDLFSITQHYCEMDPLLTLSLGDEEVVRTPVKEGTSQPVWTMREPSCALVRVTPESAGAVLKAEVFDGLVDETDLLSMVEKTVGEVCFTGQQQWSLQAPSPPPTGCSTDDVDAPRPSLLSRSFGCVVVETVCGHVGGAALPRGYISSLANDFLLGTSSSVGALDPAAGEGEGEGEGGGKEAAASPFVRCGLTNVCQILPQALSKCLEITVSDGREVVLSTVRRDMMAEGDAWQWDEAYACIDTAKLPADCPGLEVRATATQVRDGSPPPGGISTSLGSSPRHTPRTRRSGESGDAIVIGSGIIPAELLRRVAPNEVQVHTVILKAGDKPASAGPLADTVRGRGRPPTPGKCRLKLSGDYLRPNASFALIGMCEPAPLPDETKQLMLVIFFVDVLLSLPLFSLLLLEPGYRLWLYTCLFSILPFTAHCCALSDTSYSPAEPGAFMSSASSPSDPKRPSDAPPQMTLNSSAAQRPPPAADFRALHRVPLPDGVPPSDTAAAKHFSAGRCMYHTDKQEACFAVRTAAAERALNRLQRENDALKHTQINTMREQQRLQLTVKCLKQELEEMGKTLLKQTAAVRTFSSDIDRHDPCRLIRLRREAREEMDGLKTCLSQLEAENSALRSRLEREDIDRAERESEQHSRQVGELQRFCAALEGLASGGAGIRKAETVYRMRLRVLCCDELRPPPRRSKESSSSKEKEQRPAPAESMDPYVTVMGPMGGILLETSPQRGTLSPAFSDADGNTCEFYAIRHTSWLVTFQVRAFDSTTGAGPIIARAQVPLNALLSASTASGRQRGAASLQTAQLRSVGAHGEEGVSAGTICFDVEVTDSQQRGGALRSRRYSDWTAPNDHPTRAARHADYLGGGRTAAWSPGAVASPVSEPTPRHAARYDYEEEPKGEGEPGAFEGYCAARMDGELVPPTDSSVDSSADGADKMVYVQILHADSLLRRDTRRRARPFVTVHDDHPAQGRYHQLAPVFTSTVSCETRGDWHLWHEEQFVYRIHTPDGHLVFRVFDEPRGGAGRVCLGEALVPKSDVLAARLLDSTEPLQPQSYTLRPCEDEMNPVMRHYRRHLGAIVLCFFRLPEPGTKRAPRRSPAPRDKNAAEPDSLLGSISSLTPRTGPAPRHTSVPSASGSDRRGHQPASAASTPVSRASGSGSATAAALSHSASSEGKKAKTIAPPVDAPPPPPPPVAEVPPPPPPPPAAEVPPPPPPPAAEVPPPPPPPAAEVPPPPPPPAAEVPPPPPPPPVAEVPPPPPPPAAEVPPHPAEVPPPPPPPAAEVPPPPPPPAAEVPPPPPPPVAEVPPPPPPAAEVPPPPPPPAAEVPPPHLRQLHRPLRQLLRYRPHRLRQLPAPPAEVPPPPPPPVAEVPQAPTEVAETAVSWYSLRIRVREGTGLLQSGDLMDPMDDCDPRVYVWVEGEKVATIPPVHKSSHPEWPASMGEVVATVNPRQTIRFEVQDVTFFGEAMGEASISCWDAMQRADGQEVVLPVILSGKRHGQLMPGRFTREMKCLFSIVVPQNLHCKQCYKTMSITRCTIRYDTIREDWRTPTSSFSLPFEFSVSFAVCPLR
eukprot:gene4949-3550_t